MLTVLVCTMAIVAATAGGGADLASEAPIVMRIRLPGNLGVETSGNLLVAHSLRERGVEILGLERSQNRAENHAVALA